MELLAYIPFGFEGAFSPFFDQLDTMTDDISPKLTYFTATLAFIGLLIAAYKQQIGGDLGQLGNHLIMTMMVGMGLTFLPDYIYNAEEFLGWNMVNDMHIDPEDICLTAMTDMGIFISTEVAAIIANLAIAFIAPSQIIYAIVGMIVVIVVGVCALFVFVATLLAYAVEAVSVQLGVATLPLFLGMLLFPTTKETGVRYLTGIVAMLFWPLGWGIGFKLVEQVINVWADVCMACAPLVALDMFYGGIVDAFGWVIVTMMFWTVIKKAPPIITKALTTGTQIGAGLVSAGVASAASTVSSAVSAAGSVASSAISMAGSVGGAAIGGAMSGGTGAGVGASVGGAVGGAAGSMVGGGASAAASGIKGAGEGLGGMSEGV
jgi:hypothetical protein